MRPHRLRVTAFGPFPGTVDLDLDEVSGAGPFLLRGATGAGKTSLLDAVGYALFGRVPGSRGLKQLRSDHAAAGMRTSVELWATVGGRAVHVVRTPDQRRPKARGTGTTADKATVSVRVARDLPALEADDCEARWSGVQEANDELARLVGMTHEQFVQVVLLPQGDFARFLRARDDERAEVLRALFDTSRFRAVEQHLRERRDAAREALADAGTRVSAAAARVAATAGVEEVPATSLTGWAETLLAEAEAAAATAGTRAEEARAEVARARSSHASAGTLVRLLTDLLAHARTEAALLAEAPAVHALAEELAAADRAAGVVALHELHQQAEARTAAGLAAARSAVAALEEDRSDGPTAPPGFSPAAGDPATEPLTVLLERAVTADGTDPQPVQGVVAVVDARARAAVSAHARLDALERDVQRWDQHLVELTAHRAGLEDAETALADVRTAVAALPARIATLAVELERSREGAADLGAAVRAVERWDGLVAAAERLARLADEVTVAEQQDLDARAAARAAQDSYDALRRARLAGMSVELAGALRPGEPCTVCGATEHPAPATADGVPVDAAAEEAARLRSADLSRLAVGTGSALAAAVARRDDSCALLRAEAAPDLDVPAGELDRDALDALRTGLAEQASEARDRLGRAQAATDRATAVEADLGRARTEQTAAGELLSAAETAAAGCRAAVKAGEAETGRLLAHLRAVLGERVVAEPPAHVRDDLLAGSGRRVDRARSALAALTALVTALTEARRTREAADAGAADAGWPGVGAAVAAARPSAWRDSSRQDVARHERELHAAAQGVQSRRRDLAEAGVALPADGGTDLAQTAERLAAQAEVDQDQRAQVLAAAESACRQADAELTRAAAVRDGLRRCVPPLVEAERGTGPLRDQAEATRALAELCGGANDKGVPLSTYVLAAHLEQVVEAANLRLGGMSDGRYALVHVEEGEDRRRRAGLGLAVLDAWTGRQRPAGTLSGGETFLASLALALGLADVVTAEAGGARIDALFVDEGFGTLDPESLDRAMDVLDQLQEHGRMVGVVSHVGELQQRLPRQVHVQAGRSGSTVLVSTG